MWRSMRQCTRLSMIALVTGLSMGLFADGAALADEPAGAAGGGAGGGALGAPGFRASMEHPFGWRGDGTGRFPAATPPLEWSAKKNVKWSVAVGRSYSSPIVTDQLVFVLSEPNLLTCIDQSEGKIRWTLKTTAAELSDPAEKAAAGEYAPPKDGSGMTAATPVTDGKFVYFVLGNGIVRAVDLTGKSQWITYIGTEQNTGYGRSSSPILSAGKLIVHMTDLCALDPATGKRLWVNEKAKSTYGSPAAMKVGDVDVIVTPNGDVVRTDTGQSAGAGGIGVASKTTPLVEKDMVFYCENEVRALRLNGAFKDQELWNADIMGDVFSSPILHDGVLYNISAKGELFAFDAASKGSANPIFEPRKLFGENAEGQHTIFACLTLAGKHLFVRSSKGDVVVLEATREAKEVGRNKLPDGGASTPVFVGREMMIRDGDKVYCVGQ